MKLITEPDDGIQPLLRLIRSARKCIDIAIFRCDIRALERELAAAVARGVLVRALVAHTNRGGELGAEGAGASAALGRRHGDPH